MAFQGDSIFWVEVEKIVPNPFQPRREFDEQKLRELAESVRMYGILQPLTVTRNEIQREDGTFYTEYELIAGERRLRASKLAGLSQVPVIIREGEDSEQEKLELAIIENLQREDLNAVDRALAFRQLADVFGLSHTQVAKKVGRSREYVSNSIRLLALPDYMLSSLKLGEMTEGHARTLLMLNDRPEEQDVVFREILMKKLSVREVERIVRKIATDKVRKKNPDEFDAELIEIEKKFMETLGTRVQIQKTDYGGRLTIDYFSVDDLEGMLTRMKVEQASKPYSSVAAAEKLNQHTPLEMAVDDSGREPAMVSDAAILSGEPDVVVTESEAVSTTLTQYDATADDIQLYQAPAVPMVEEHYLVMTEPLVAPIAEVQPETVPPAPAYVPPSYDTPRYVAYHAPQAVHESAPVVASPAPVFVPVSAPDPVSVPVAPEPTPPPKEDDESGLYSIRNFGV
jgi:ParB family transcriptional regulator, chromosome partitioning protein